MKAIEFESELTTNDRILIPPDVARQLPSGSHVRVILLLDAGEDENWRNLSLQRFAAAYAPEDSVYETLLDESQST